MLKNKSKTVLILSTYPIKKLFHGGQYRLSEIKSAYIQAGYRVVSLASYEEESYTKEEISKNDIPFPEDNQYRFFYKNKIPNSSDILSGDFIINDEKSFNKIKSLVNNIKIDLIHFEQPGMFPVVQGLKKIINNSDLLIIYGSQNIESEMKKKIYSNNALLNNHNINQFLDFIKEREIQSCKISDLTLVVTKRDQQWFKKHSLNTKTMLIENGVRSLSDKNLKIDKIKKIINVDKWISYIASAHPPNIDGFNVFIGDSLGCIPPDAKLVLAGSASELISNKLKSSNYQYLNNSRLFSFGKINQNYLNNIIMGSHAIILPISSGGGSNLKTAEALISNKYIVATKKAFEGYEKFLKLSGVFIGNDQRSFRKLITKTFSLPPLQRTLEEKMLLKSLLWKNRVKPLIKFLLKEN